MHKTYETFESSFLDVVNKHIPLKKTQEHTTSSSIHEPGTKTCNIQEKNAF